MKSIEQLMEQHARWEVQERRIQFVGKAALVLGAVMLCSVLWMALVSFDRDAMERCQNKGYSYDTCFHSLNR